jgi:excisionase family DNA binding protein
MDAGMTSAIPTEPKVKKSIILPPGAKLSYSVGESAEALGLSPATVWDMIRKGELEAKRLRGRTLLPLTELERVLAEAPGARAA